MNATSYPSHRVRTCLAQETPRLTYVSLRPTSLHLSTSFPPKQTPPPLHLPSTASYPPKPTPSSSPPFPPKHLPQPTFKGHSLSSLSLYSSLVLSPSHSTYIISTLSKPLTSSVIKELETKAAPRLTTNEKLHNPHSGVHKALPERSTKLTTEDPNVELNSVRGILNTPAHTGPTASATPASNKRRETTNNEEDCQSTAEVLSSLDDVTKSLNATLAHTLADGHCFLHAVALQLKETPNSMQAYKFLMKAIETQSTRNKNHYRNFIDENSGRHDLLVQKYLHSKIFDHAAGDLIPQITSNALQKPIHIYSERDGGIWKTIVQPTMPRNINKSPLLVHLKDCHYSALIKEKNASIKKISASR
ncbi:OTU domain [Trinorchestia longiramus]|nr:OTU domain [Trinorchestia longiramus]